VDKAKYYAMLVLACLLWGGTPASGRVLAAKLSPLLLTGIRFFCMASLIFVFLILSGQFKQWIPKGRTLFVLFLMGATGVFLHNGLLMLGLHYTTASNTALIESVGPAVTSVLAFLIIGERLSPLGWAGIFIACQGAVCIVTRGDPAALLRMDVNAGDLIVLVAESMWSVYTVISWYLPARYNAAAATAWSGMMGMALCFAGGALAGELHYEPMDTGDCLTFAFMVLGPGLIAFIGWNWAVLRVGASKAGSFCYIVPIAGALVGVLLLDETLLISQILGGAIIIFGMILTARAKLGRSRGRGRDIPLKKLQAASAGAKEKS
jgi:drug/metabolite transporter (DMT)-like permease